MVPGLARTSRTKSASVFQRLSVRTASTVGSAVSRAIGLNWLTWNDEGRPLIRSEIGIEIMLGKAIISV